MDSYYKENNWTGQQDRQDNAAFGRKAPRRRRKKFLIILSKNKNNKNGTHSAYIHFFEVSYKVSAEGRGLLRQADVRRDSALLFALGYGLLTENGGLLSPRP
jgi:hypothetical protein